MSTDRSTRIQYASDLHLEFPINRAWLAEYPIVPSAPILLLAGDIIPFDQLPSAMDFFRRLGSQYEEVIWTPGNHEYYGSDISQRSGPFEEKILPNVRLVNDWAACLEGLRILATTLWTAIDPLQAPYITQSMSDYRAIRQGDRALTPHDSSVLHVASRDWLERELAAPFDGETIVMTHHVPTLKNYPPEYKGDLLNQAFAVELDELIKAHEIKAWIYGHHHRMVPSFELGGTQILSNQLGYVQYGEHRDFKMDAVFSI